jgi:phage shock protein E
VNKSYEELVAEAREATEHVGVEEVHGALEDLSAEELPDRGRRIVVHCNAGGRGALAAKSLMEMGYTNVANLEGGLNAWRERGYEVE